LSGIKTEYISETASVFIVGWKVGEVPIQMGPSEKASVSQYTQNQEPYRYHAWFGLNNCSLAKHGTKQTTKSLQQVKQYRKEQACNTEREERWHQD
jgi:hypothetical protein